MSKLLKILEVVVQDKSKKIVELLDEMQALTDVRVPGGINVDVSKIEATVAAISNAKEEAEELRKLYESLCYTHTLVQTDFINEVDRLMRILESRLTPAKLAQLRSSFESLNSFKPFGVI